jgi:hypothetical protein
MFYDYLKSIYNIVEKYDPHTDNFQNMLELNDRFINDIGKDFDSYNKIQSIQSGGQKMRMISIVSFNKFNKPKGKQSGGNPIDDIKIMNKSITDMIDKLSHRDQPDVDLSELKAKIEKFKNTMNKLIEYIELLHSAGPSSDNMLKLSDQLKQIKDILQKY